MVMIKSNERVFICGKTQSGKSYLMKHFLNTFKRVLVIDIKHSQSLNDLKDKYKVITTSNGFWDWDDKILYRPTSFRNYEKDLDTLLYKVFNHGNRVVIFDEIVIGDSDFIPEGALALLRMGAERGIGVWILTQKPTHIRMEYIDQAEHYFIFKLNWERDRSKLVSILGDGSEKHLAYLKKYEFLYANQSGFMQKTTL